MIPAIQTAIGQAATHNLTAHSELHKVFEAYLFAIAVAAAKKVSGATVQYQTTTGVATNALLFAGGPGFLWRPTSPDTTHAYVSWPDSPAEYEIHLNCYIAGESKVLHEADLAIIDRSEGVRSRVNHVHPRYSKVVAAVECKFYASNLSVSEGRNFIGWATDVHRQGCLAVNSPSTAVKRLTAKRYQMQSSVVPGDASINRMSSYFENALINHRARQSP